MLENKMEITKCLICSSESFFIKSFKENLIYKCNSCKLEFVDPIPSKKELDNFYLNYSNPRAREDISKKNAKKNIEYLKKYGLTKKSKLLDFGCGDNFFIQQGNLENWFGYDKYTQPLMPPEKFDFITLWGVLEHLINPVETLESLIQKLNKNGKIILTTVGTETGINYQYKVPEHITWWNKKSVKELFNKTKLELREISNYFMYQNPKVYLDCVLNAGRVPEKLKKLITLNIEEDIYVLTNEIFIVGEKIYKK